MNKTKLTIYALYCILFITILTEILLGAIDPWGAVAYFGDLAKLNAHYLEIEGRYVLSLGDYRFSHWEASVNWTRSVPATNEKGTCTIVFVGDSQTFGHGVNDVDTWVNVLAQQYPQYNFINAGMDGYNTSNVVATVQQIRADGYFYLFNPNDVDEALTIQKPTGHYSSNILTYLYVWRKNQPQDPNRPPKLNNTVEDFDRAQKDIESLPINVVIVGYGDGPVIQYFEKYMVGSIQHGRGISYADPHANEEGNRFIAQQIKPYVDELIEQVCS